MNNQVVLSPVGEDRSIATIGDELLRELGNLRVVIVHDVVDDTLCLWSPGGVVVIGIGHNSIGGLKTIHIYVTVGLQFFEEFPCE